MTLNWKSPGGKEMLIVGLVVAGGALLWFSLRGGSKSPAAGGSPSMAGQPQATTIHLEPQVIRLWIHDHQRSPGRKHKEPREKHKRKAA